MSVYDLLAQSLAHSPTMETIKGAGSALKNVLDEFYSGRKRGREMRDQGFLDSPSGSLGSDMGVPGLSIGQALSVEPLLKLRESKIDFDQLNRLLGGGGESLPGEKVSGKTAQIAVGFEKQRRSQKALSERAGEARQARINSKVADIKLKTQEKTDEADGALDQLRILKDEYDKIAKSGRGGSKIVGSVTSGISRVTGGGFGTGDIKAFNDLSEGLISTLRGIAQEKGILSDQDRAALRNIVFSVSESPQSANQKMALISKIVGRANTIRKARMNAAISAVKNGVDDPSDILGSSVVEQTASESGLQGFGED